jgi:serine/threonine protein kinase
MTIARGVTLGPYEILAHIGAGGMGDVWRARDRRIGRDVAIKVLNDSYAPGDERVHRFEQESRAAGALNHPGLVTIFDVGTTSDGSPYIVMELLEGETLRDAIGDVMPTPLPLRKTVDYAMQTASALAVAHEKGIIHRDLKPENIFITPDGRVKILDFGLAKLAGDAVDADMRHQTARHLTSAGMVVGTPGYMSPEQVRAQPLDYRTDIFSLGAVLYEMISGKRAFDRDSAVETMHAVLSEEPESLTSIAPRVPLALEAIVHHCLEKNPRERFQSARDLAFQLRMLPEFQNSRTDNLEPLPKPKKLPPRIAIAAAAVLALAAVGFTLLHRRAGSVTPTSARTYKQLTFREGLTKFPTLSPDGKTFAYVSAESGNEDIYVQRVDGRAATNITSDSPANDSEPAFSPDGSQIAFRSERDGGGIFVMGVTGESVRRITDFGHHPSWSPDSKRIAVSTVPVNVRPQFHGRPGALWIIDTRTGAKRLLVDPDHIALDALQPSWSPHGKRIAFWGLSKTTHRNIWTVDPDAPQPQSTIVQVTSDAALHWNPIWSPDGQYLYFGSDRDGTLNLWRAPVDEATGQPTGDVEPLYLPSSFSGHFAFSEQGDLIYTALSLSDRLLAFPFDRSSGKVGDPLSVFASSQEIESYEPSPNGKFMAFTSGGAQEDIFVAEIHGGHLSQLTNDAAKDRGVTWSPDGKTLYFFSNREGGFHIWSIHADGSGLTRLTTDSDFRRFGALYMPNASPDGRDLAARTDHAPVLVHLDRPMGQRLESFEAELAQPRWSPDGRRIAGEIPRNGGGVLIYSLESRRAEIISNSGRDPLWLPDAHHIAFFDAKSVGIVDLDSRHVTTTPWMLPHGVILGHGRLSSDGTTLYVRQRLEQGDVWIVRFQKP